jgi:hypothetical protein
MENNLEAKKLELKEIEKKTESRKELIKAQTNAVIKESHAVAMAVLKAGVPILLAFLIGYVFGRMS